MKKNIPISLLIYCLTSSIISGCSVHDTDNSTTSSEPISETTTASQVVTPTTEATTIEDLRTQDVIDAAWESRLDYCGSGLDDIPAITIEYNESGRILHVDPANYPELSTSVDILFEDAEETVRQYSESPDNNAHINAAVRRCDNRLISFSRSIANYEYHDDRTYDYTNDIDYITLDHLGNELELDDIVVDHSFFIATIGPLLAEKYPDDQDVAEVQFVDFYMSYDSVVLIYELDMGSGADDSQRVSISVGYREYADLFVPCYLPGDGTLIDYCPDLSSLGWSPDNSHDEYYHELSSYMLVMNHNGTDYCFAVYVHPTDIDPDNDWGILYVLYDIDTDTEIASAESASSDLFDDSQYILDFIDDNL